MEKYYTSEPHTQMLIALMKAHGIRKVIVSPGATNVCFVGSVQQDSYFQLYSSVDERSAAYLACGLAEESGEPVALSCTGATASRNYVPGLTEAYYRKLPVLAITSSQYFGRVGQLFEQVIDRSVIMKDIARCSVMIPMPHAKEDFWSVNVRLNQALLELTRHGGGPVHVNLETTYSQDYSIKELPDVRVIRRIGLRGPFPEIAGKTVAVIVGAHSRWSRELTEAAGRFCARYNGVILCGQNSNYKGEYQIMASLVTSQQEYRSPCRDVDLLIHIGEVSGSYLSLAPREVWRVSPDGEIRDPFRKLSRVFEMEEEDFFLHYVNAGQSAEEKPTEGTGLIQEEESKNRSCFSHWQNEYQRLYEKIPELPFSNPWIASHTASRLPEGCVLHLGILNTLRSWDFFRIPASVQAYANTGGFGIDGDVSSLLGASLADSEKLYIGIVGDLAFFYDLNAIGNRHVGRNLRLMLINNGCGTEFRNYNHPAARFGDGADAFMAAAGHFGNQSRTLVRDYAAALGFEYRCAENKEEYLAQREWFLRPGLTEKPLFLEIFTDSREESEAIRILQHLEVSASGMMKNTVKQVLGENGTNKLRALLKK